MNHYPHKQWFKIAVMLALGWLTALSVYAQSGTGTVQGRVYNPASGEYTRNAEIRVQGTSLVAFSQADGSFRLPNVPAGDVTLTVTFIGYNPVTETFTLTAGQTAVRDINLVSTAAASRSQDGVVELQAFTVSSEREGNSKAIMEQRQNMNIVTAVSSDIFGDVTDGNVGEFLKYLPGVDLDYVESEARGPRLGGMDAQYTGVSFDGVRMASADANRGGEASRATSFESFAITSIDSIEVSRTTSPESPADSPSGTINMKTKRAFNRSGRSINYNASLNFNSEEWGLSKRLGPDERENYKWRPNYTLEYADVFMDRRLGILLGASHAESYTEQYDMNIVYNKTPTATDARPMVVTQLQFKDGPKWIYKDAFTATADFRATDRLTLSGNFIYTYTVGEFWNRNFNFTPSANNTNATNGRGNVGGNGVTEVVATATATNTEPRIDNAGGSEAKKTYSRTISPRFEYKVDAWEINGAFTFSAAVNDYDGIEEGFSNSEGGLVRANWIATRENPTSYEWTIRQTSGPDWIPLANYTNTNTRDGGTRVTNSGRRWITEIWDGQLSAKWVTPIQRFPTAIKFGGQWNEENRINNNWNDWRIWSYTGPGGNTVAFNNTLATYQNTAFGNWANLGYIAPHEFDLGTTNALTMININGQVGNPQRADRNKIGALFRSNPELFVSTATPDNFYTSFVANARDLSQTVTAGFLQFDTNFSPKLTVRYGVRFENTLNEFYEFDPRRRDEVIAAGHPWSTANSRSTTFAGLQYQYFSNPKVTRESEYDDWFPSIMGKYKILPNLEFQVGFNKAISRPPIDNLTGVWIIDEDNLRVTAPNAGLLPEYSDNYQTRLAYYFEGRSPGQLSVAVSQNDISNLRTTRDLTAEEFGTDDPEFQAFTFRTTDNNIEERRFRGLEVQYNQTLGFLPDLFRGTNVNVAYTRTYANIRRNNMAPHRLTSRLGYAYKRFNGAIGMVYRDDSPDGNDGRYKRALTQFDLTLNWRLHRRATLFVQGRNIFNQPVLWYDTPPGLTEGTNAVVTRMQEYGANWVFGVKGTF